MAPIFIYTEAYLFFKLRQGFNNALNTQSKVNTVMTIQPPPKRYLWLWFLWLGIFYAAWISLVQSEAAWATTLEHWPMAIAMTLGSYAAGSTPMGGGTVGFPVLVLLFDLPASLGRDFSFAVQSVGMVSASIFILVRRQAVAWPILKGAMLGSLFGTPFGILFIAPGIPDLWIKIIFAIIWGSFGLLHLYRINEISSHTGMTEFDEKWDHKLGFILGLGASALAVAVTGVGIDMVIYAALVLLCRADLKIAIPTSVIIMAFSSVCGVIVKFMSDSWQPGVYENWLAAAPIVALGAPLGVFVVSFLDRKYTLLMVATLCVGQFFWTCYNEYNALGITGITLATLAVGLCLLGFERLRHWGAQLTQQDPSTL